MIGYVVLLKYTTAGRQHATREGVRRRLAPVMSSAAQTLGGELLSVEATLGPYDYVARLAVPPDRDVQIFQCLVNFQNLGDFDITVMRAVSIDEAYPR